MKKDYWMADTNGLRIYVLIVHHEDGTDSKAIVTNASIQRGAQFHSTILARPEDVRANWPIERKTR